MTRWSAGDVAEVTMRYLPTEKGDTFRVVAVVVVMEVVEVEELVVLGGEVAPW